MLAFLKLGLPKHAIRKRDNSSSNERWTSEIDKRILQHSQNIQSTEESITVDVVDDVKVCALQLLLEAVEVLTVTLKVLHLRNLQEARASSAP